MLRRIFIFMDPKPIAAAFTVIVLVCGSGDTAFGGKGGGRGGNNAATTTSVSTNGGGAKVSGSAPVVPGSRGAPAPDRPGWRRRERSANLFDAVRESRSMAVNRSGVQLFRQGQGTRLTTHHGTGVKKTSNSLGNQAGRSTGAKSGANDSSHLTATSLKQHGKPGPAANSKKGGSPASNLRR